MKRNITLLLIFFISVVFSFSFKNGSTSDLYVSTYHQHLNEFRASLQSLQDTIRYADLAIDVDVVRIQEQIAAARTKMKSFDFWSRYLDPLSYKKINGPLPVEWETEVFEKFEKPYKRECAGLTLASLYLEEDKPTKDSLLSLVAAAYTATETFKADSITSHLDDYHHFYLCNRLYLLNLAAIYTTGFECPNTDIVVQELRSMMAEIGSIYTAFNESFPYQRLPDEYLHLYANALAFINAQPDDYAQFDHFRFIKDYVNPLYLKNQKLINKYKVISRSLIDYSLTKNEVSIFDKSLYNGQDAKGIFRRVKDSASIAEIERLGRLLFYDPILSGNNMRSCASCHKPTEFFTDTSIRTAFHFNHTDFLPRNTPALVNAQYNHLLMADGKHYTMQHQAKDVITNPGEMACDEKEVIKKILGCKEYKNGFDKLLKYTPQEPELSLEHIASALTFYYARFSKCYSPFDQAINNNTQLNAAAKEGFNLFMSKAQCATCHFVPQFNGVKPPYIGSEFEVLGVPKDTNYKELSADRGRYDINPAYETKSAFRTGTIRNAAKTKPYMHNGVFSTLEQVIDFYDAGGGAGHGLILENQTLSADSLRLTAKEKTNLIAFIESLNENIVFESAPKKLPKSKIKSLNGRKPGGIY